MLLVVSPKQPRPDRSWIWRAEFHDHEPQVDLALLEEGFHYVYSDVSNLYGAPIAMEHFDRVYEFVTREHRLAHKAVLEGFSRGGLFVYNWAARHADAVACIYADAPVCDFKSWPAGKGQSAGSLEDWQRLQAVYGFASEAAALAYGANPVDNLQALAAAGIRLLHVCGDADRVVPVAENTAVLAERYRQLGGQIELILKPGVGHHPHCLADPTAIVRFILRHRGGRTMPHRTDWPASQRREQGQTE